MDEAALLLSHPAQGALGDIGTSMAATNLSIFNGKIAYLSTFTPRKHLNYIFLSSLLYNYYSDINAGE